MVEVSAIAFGIGALSVAITIAIVLFGIGRFVMTVCDHGIEIERNSRDIDLVDKRVSDANRDRYKLDDEVDALRERIETIEELMSDVIVGKLEVELSKNSPKKGKA